MYMHVYMYMYVYMYMHGYMYMHVYMFMYMCMYMCMFIYVYVFVLETATRSKKNIVESHKHIYFHSAGQHSCKRWNWRST